MTLYYHHSPRLIFPWQRLARIHELELKRRGLLHRTELLHRDEEARRATVEWLALKDENATLHHELQQTHLERRDLKGNCDYLGEQLKVAHELARSQEAKLNQQVGELSSLQVCSIPLFVFEPAADNGSVGS